MYDSCKNSIVFIKSNSYNKIFSNNLYFFKPLINKQWPWKFKTPVSHCLSLSPCCYYDNYYLNDIIVIAGDVVLLFRLFLSSLLLLLFDIIFTSIILPCKYCTVRVWYDCLEHHFYSIQINFLIPYLPVYKSTPHFGAKK